MTSTDTIENQFDVDIATPQQQQLSSIHPASPSNKSVRSCRACGHLCVKRNGPLVKALGEIYHYQCFVCEVQSCTHTSWGYGMVLRGMCFAGEGVGDIQYTHLLDSRYQGGGGARQ